MTPDLASYDVIEISSSGGKDSLAMKVHVAALARAAGVLDRVTVVHADMGRAEWPGTPELVEAQAKHLGLGFMKVRREQGDLLEHVEAMGFWPKPGSRYCTSDHKRAQILRALTMLADEARREGVERQALLGARFNRPIRILNCVGLRAEESPPRAHHLELAREKRGTGKGYAKVVDMWLPVQHLTLEEVWTLGHSSGAPIHPAYAAGFPRASCRFCIYMSRPALVLAGTLFPDLLAEYVRVERKIGHDFKYRLPIAQVAADVAAGVMPDGPIESWCM